MIELEYNGKTYQLEYTRRTVKAMEDRGFNLDAVSTKPATMLPMLFEGAFLQNHKGVKRALIDELYENICNKSELHEALATMYGEALSSLVDSEEAEGNVTWRVCP